MTKKILLPILVAGLATLAACSAKKATATAAAITQADADKAAINFPGATLASLNEGKMHYENNCGKCHALFQLQNSVLKNGIKLFLPWPKKLK
ncbi:MAG: hypothetical protein IPP69_14320 [Flavobacteriales bacterium]|nr:hypothetical protein [Flavobacteriales bacterium]